MKITAEPRSDQWNADDFIGSPRTFTIAKVKPGSAEQKYDIELVEGEGRVWRPPLTILRLLMAAWGDEANDWIGRRVTLYRDETVRFGPDAVGGIRVSHMSHLPGNKTFETRITSARGRKSKVSVEPLSDTDRAATASPRPEGAYTPDHERVIKGHMERAHIPPARVLELARQTAGRDVKSARELSSVEADALIVLLAELVDPDED
jgi:hypothetical protein